MFAPPPASSLTKEELVARRAQARLALQAIIQNKNSTDLTRVVSDSSSDGSGSIKSSSSAQLDAIQTSLIRKIGLTGLVKDKNSPRPDISSPILNVAVASKPLPSRPTESPGDRASNTRDDPSVHSSGKYTPPRRPPRPAHGLSMRSVPTLASYRLSAQQSTPPQTHQPAKRYIHLRNGSVVTVTPPVELDCWVQRVYLPGPIRLLRPNLMSRRGSLASLEPFQDMLDNSIQTAVGRRRSEDTTAKDVCMFFEDFGTCDSYPDTSDSYCVPEDSDEEGTLPINGSPDRFLTPPDSPLMVAADSRPMDVILLEELLPVETEETLRARGIASVRRSRDLEEQLAASKEGDNQTDSCTDEVSTDAASELTGTSLIVSDTTDANAVTSHSKTSSREEDLFTTSAGLQGLSAPWVRSNRDHKAASVLKRFSQ